MLYGNKNKFYNARGPYDYRGRGAKTWMSSSPPLIFHINNWTQTKNEKKDMQNLFYTSIVASYIRLTAIY